MWLLKQLGVILLLLVHLTQANVHHIYANQLDSLVQSHRLVLLTLYAPWCNHCRLVLPVIERVALRLMNTSIDASLAMIDMSLSMNKELFESLPIFGYPTLLLFRDGNLVEGYSGSRTEK